jgi:hypothetical protein
MKFSFIHLQSNYKHQACSSRAAKSTGRLFMNSATGVNILTPRSEVLLEKLIIAQLLKKFPTSYGKQRFIAMFTGVH